MEVRIPSLIENDTKFFIKHALRTSRDYKDKYITIATNVILFLLFIAIFGGLLYYKYKGKPSQEEINYKNNEKKKYFFQKLQKYQSDKQKESQQMITNLPTF
tara:strand:- start:360 stop:665 length:306 start_codon:yes stop_codon:yes gene_type:complete